jgi:hypothetical protein
MIGLDQLSAATTPVKNDKERTVWEGEIGTEMWEATGELGWDG